MQIPRHYNNKQQKNSIGSRLGTANTIIVLSVTVLGLIAAAWIVGKPRTQPAESELTQTSQTETNAANKLYPVTIRKPAGPPRVFAGLNDIHGQPVTVACSTCHATRKTNFENKTVADLDEFHGSLSFSHGAVSCLSCHNSNDYEALKLADGSRVEYTEVMTLCAQCHGQQMKEYEHGVHGGFTGYWDLTRGPRKKNNCIDCHDPHSPSFPKMQPTFKPLDRFLQKIHKED